MILRDKQFWWEKFLRYLIAPDAVHHVFLKDYKSAYPQAKLIGVKEHLAKYNEKDLKFDGGKWGLYYDLNLLMEAISL